jgi:UDPglucose 6-dehydrogenase/UDP-N-acetyl-D-galactosamine dehydrogenase
MHDNLEKSVVCIIGLGYVGLPLAEAFSKHFKVIGFDINTRRVKELKAHNNDPNLIITKNARFINEADFIIICVPTPVTKSKDPDLSYIIKASMTISKNMKADCTVILESTVYPGVTEEVVKPILEKSGRRCGRDFKIGYSPERINPGDNEHTISQIVKVVAGYDDETTEILTQLYGRICPSIFKAKNIKTAEAAKVIENVQRDINIALINELSVIFQLMGLKTKDVIEAAATKWNFQLYSPGLVGGHCIPVDPYYLVHKANELDYHPQVILAGRSINDYMPKHVAHMAIKALNNKGKTIKGSKILIMGLTYKENVPDTRETKIHELIKESHEYGLVIYGYDPLLNNIESEFGIKHVNKIQTLTDIDCTIINVKHDCFSNFTLNDIRTIMSTNPILIDIHNLFNELEAIRMGFYYLNL